MSRIIYCLFNFASTLEDIPEHWFCFSLLGCCLDCLELFASAQLTRDVVFWVCGHQTIHYHRTDFSGCKASPPAQHITALPTLSTACSELAQSTQGLAVLWGAGALSSLRLNHQESLPDKQRANLDSEILHFPSLQTGRSDLSHLCLWCPGAACI